MKEGVHEMTFFYKGFRIEKIKLEMKQEVKMNELE